MESHVRTLAILHIIFSALGLVAALVIFLVFGGIAGLVAGAGGADDARVAIPVLGAIGSFLFFLLLALSLPGLVAGIGLLKFRPWARILTIVLSVFDLFHVPLGTALGVYGLWVLLSPETERLFRRT